MSNLPRMDFRLARWHREDVIPKPRVRRLGKAHGTETLYPPGTGTQLLAACAIRDREKRFPDLRWRLWWEGFHVPAERIGDYLRETATWMDAAIADLPALDDDFLREAETDRSRSTSSSSPAAMTAVWLPRSSTHMETTWPTPKPNCGDLPTTPRDSATATCVSSPSRS